MTPTSRPRTALVLCGGGARGAYEAGIISFLRDELEPGLGRRLNLDILSGSSVGAINACYLAATADAPQTQSAQLIDHWQRLKIDAVLKFTGWDMLRMAAALIGRPSRKLSPARQTGLVDPVGLAEYMLRPIPWSRIGRNLRQGHLLGLSITATPAHTGRPVVFVQHRPELTPWTADARLPIVETRIGPRHALASAAIPLLFPAVDLDGTLYVDGSLRMSVPLSPALRLGARRVAVISLKWAPEVADAVALEPSTSAALTVATLMGKTLNALLLDRTDQDLERLRQINRLLEAGTQAFGSGFIDTLSDAMPVGSPRMRYIRELMVRPSVDIGRLTADHVRTPSFAKRNPGFLGRLLRRLVERETRGEADLASYLLFDGEFANKLIELGRIDARAAAAEWVRFWADEAQSPAEAASQAFFTQL